MGVTTGQEVKGVPAVLFLHGLQWLLAYLSLDLVFRTVDVRPGLLARSRARCRQRYVLAAAAATLAIGAAQVWITGGAGAAAAGTAGLGWLPWWLLWRFGWRKQFPHLYQEPPEGKRV